jgi:hypothetical protein
LPHVPQSEKLVSVLTQNGEQQMSAGGMHACPLAQDATHWKFQHSSPLGHCELWVHSAQAWVSRLQCGVGAAQSASLWQP